MLRKEIKSLVSDLEQNKLENEKQRKNLERQLNSAKQNGEILENETKKQVSELQALRANNDNLEQIVKKLNTGLSETRSRLLKEKGDITENLNKEIKNWKKKLGKERKSKIKLERKLKQTTSEIDRIKAQEKVLNTMIEHTINSVASVSSGSTSISTKHFSDTSKYNLNPLPKDECHHAPQCLRRHPNPPTHYAPTSAQNRPNPPPNIRLLPREAETFQIFNQLSSCNHECEECSEGDLFHDFHEMLHYPDPGPCGGTSGSPVKSCPNNPFSQIEVFSSPQISKKIIKKCFKCDVCSQSFTLMSNLVFHRNRIHEDNQL